MRVVIYQGQYGIFKKNGLDLSMPAIQTCLGLYALSDQHDYLLCAHFDSAFGLQQNLQDIKRSIELNGIRMSSLRATVFWWRWEAKLFTMLCSQQSYWQ